MARVYTSDELIASMRNSGMVPSVQSPGADDASLLRHLSETLLTQLLPELMTKGEDYYVASQRSAIVANQSRYRMPSRAAYNKLRRLAYVASDLQRVWLQQIRPEELSMLDSNATGDPRYWYLEGNDIVVLPTPGASSGFLEFSFYFRPGDLILAASARVVTAVNLGTKQVTLASTVPADWTNTDLFDVHSPSSGAECKVWDAAATTVAGTGITFTAAIDGTTYGTKAVEVGDYVVLAGEAAVPALPKDMHPLLAEMAAMRYAKARGDTEKVKLFAGAAGPTFQAVGEVTRDRVESHPRPITGRRGLLWPRSMR